jgi:NAD(P)-dependent dehydrogenase (short-subunit alcohol dehydrogenase family)
MATRLTDLAGKVALVTGAGSGIGLGMARAFARAGATVIAADLDPEAARACADEPALQATGSGALALDVSDREAWSEAVRRLRATHGRVHVICNNAGISYSRFPLSELAPQAWDRLMNVNVTGVFNGVHAFVNGLCEPAEGAHIVNTASILGWLSVPDLGAYVTSKFAVVGMSEVLRHELAPRGIGVSVLCPGFVSTRIAVNSMKYTDASADRQAFAAEREAAARMFESAMDPACVGERVVEAVRRDAFFVFTHPEYRAVLERRFGAALAAFGESAQPGYADDITMLGRSWLDAEPPR